MGFLVGFFWFGFLLGLVGDFFRLGFLVGYFGGAL